MKKQSQLIMAASLLFIIAGLIALVFNLNCCDIKSLCQCGCDEDDEDEVYM